ncbi:MAG TPA: hypothetical protein DCE42_22610 [Myxococcales bacterium]|nr:hypothetical protein [Deltaproteobacteria bacterium]MBU54353.1 hypothetical protein [Deltaproteobacteria bacterium]HAA57576.1 hypothetical protein [Myxococcales bacterium]|tara:strand:+ start:609 stop:2042 length:1434 start_codon:yes stop_codon:yes gene_type:complete
MRRYGIIGIFCFLSCLLFAQHVHAYTYMNGNPRWAFSKMPIPWYVTYTDKANWSGRDLADIKKIVQDAFNTWEQIDCSFMMFKYMGTTKVGAIKGDGVNVIEWVASLPNGASASAVGLGGPIWGGGGAVKEGNVWLKAGTRSDKAQMMILTHEVGHAIGFGHTTTTNAIMAPAYNSKTHLTEDDRKALCNAYPISSNTCTESSHCPAGLVCNGGRCGKCATDGNCPDKHYCDRGTCFPSCDKDSDCDPKGRICMNNRCTTCSKDEDCGSDRFCEQDLCKDKCKTDADCDANSECRENGRCIPRGGCTATKDCKEGEYCSNGTCIGQGSLGKLCEGANDCGDGQNCVIHDCSEDLECHEGYVCDTESKACIKPGDKDNKASICSIACKEDGKETPCPGSFSCKEWSATVSYCFPPKREPQTTNPEDPTKGEGCGCSAQKASTPGPWIVSLMGIWFFLLLIGRERRRSWLSFLTLRTKQ